MKSDIKMRIISAIYLKRHRGVLEGIPGAERDRAIRHGKG